MKLNEIAEAKGSRTPRKRVGRGPSSGLGKTAGKGQKGQKSRSGVALAGFEGGQMPLHRRVPMRGFNNSNFAKTFEIVNLSQISKLKVKNVDAEVMSKNGLISSIFAPVKVLGNGSIDKAVNVTASSFSDSAAKKIEDAGGKATTL